MVTTTAAVALSVGAVTVAQADDGVVHGTHFPLGSRVQLSYVGCASLFSRTGETLQPTVALGPATPPAGQRSLGYDLAGGNAVGMLAHVDDVATTSDVGMSAIADAGTSTGVAYVGYAVRGRDARMWIGRAPVTASGTWSSDDATDLRYSWTLVDTARRRTLSRAGSASIAAFTARHGDGPGFFTVGFGCDGKPFHMDALRLDGSTTDLEGLDPVAGIGSGRRQIAQGDSVTLTGTLHDSYGDPIWHGWMVLEARVGNGTWHAIDGVDASGGSGSVTLSPRRTAQYRFRFVARDLAPGTASAALTITVAGETSTPNPSGSTSPTGAPTGTPTGTPTGPTSTPSDDETRPDQTGPDQTGPDQTEPGTPVAEHTSAGASPSKGSADASPSGGSSSTSADSSTADSSTADSSTADSSTVDSSTVDSSTVEGTADPSAGAAGDVSYPQASIQVTS
ncbi:MAG: hypothetical protein QM638_10065 [Nocardioides sp.]|uniref:hypothetical protein n=1 Tax=Nocardioides sp. TaxID=35761 RepID=UPI0039E27E42